MATVVKNSMKHPPKLKNQTDVGIPHYSIYLKEVKQLFGNDICTSVHLYVSFLDLFS